MAGASRGEERLQRAITHHLEEEERAQLYSAFHSFAAHGYETPGMGLGGARLFAVGDGSSFRAI